MTELDYPTPDIGRYAEDTSTSENMKNRAKRKRVKAKRKTRPTYPGHPHTYAPHVWNQIPPRDPNEYYVEEDAWKYHNPPLGGAVPAKDLRPLPEAPPLPDFPDTGLCKWSFDPHSRVVLAKFHKSTITLEDERFILHMMERDDISLISEGLVKGLDSNQWGLSSIASLFGIDDYHHKFRRFNKLYLGGSKCTYKEVDGMLSMRIRDYFSYLELQRKCLRHGCGDHLFSFLNYEGAEQTIDLTNTVIYMIDFDMVKLLPTLYKDFESKFGLAGILPGGHHCLMNHIYSRGRPFMGPNLYVTPPGSFTHFHQDGYGTVDSGHFCLRGFNEVVMLRRMTERHKLHAIDLLRGDSNFRALYDLPHSDQLGDKPNWPSVSAIEECKNMRYYPSIFILKPGQLLHINKGKIHAFRKLSTENLPDTDCHGKLRNELLDSKGHTTEYVCISVAWDWMFRGVSSEGINREVVSMLECAELNRRHMRQSLATPELCLLQMARSLAPPKNQQLVSSSGDATDPDVTGPWTSSTTITSGFIPKTCDTLRGILPGLRCVINDHLRGIERIKGLTPQSKPRRQDRINWEEPPNFPLDPYGEGNFYCELCFKELSNIYFHCDGCENLLSEDFNICLRCHSEKQYKTRIAMSSLTDQVVTTAHHLADLIDKKSRGCQGTLGEKCHLCGLCTCCSCKCHTNFTMRLRFFTKQDEEDLLKRVEDLVGTKMLETSNQVEERLRIASTGGFEHS